MLFNGVWDAGGSVDCKAGAENIRPAVFPTNEAGMKASLLSGGTGFEMCIRDRDNPNVKFILVDSYPADAEGKEAEMDNVYAMQ